MSLQRAVIFLLMATLEPGKAQMGLVNFTFITFCFIDRIFPTFTAAPTWSNRTSSGLNFSTFNNSLVPTARSKT